MILESINGLEKRVSEFHNSMNPAVAEERIGQAVDKVRATFRSDALGVAIDLAPEDVVRKYRSAAQAQYSKNLRETAATLSAELRATERALEEATAAAGSLPHPLDALDLQPASENTKAIERLRVVMETDRAERRLAGKTRAQIVDLYAQAKDTRDATLIWYIEAQHDAGWPEVALASTPDDAVAIMHLKRLITERQQARVATNFPEVAQARERLAKLRSATLDSQTRHLLSGRGLAAVS